MLAQNFKTATDLGIEDRELEALIKVLGMLERGDFVDSEGKPEGDNLFCMYSKGEGCGTPACIGGWVALLIGVKQIDYLNRHDMRSSPLHELYWNNRAVDEAKVAHSAIALRSYLTTGEPRWEEAIASQ